MKSPEEIKMEMTIMALHHSLNSRVFDITGLPEGFHSYIVYATYHKSLKPMPYKIVAKNEAAARRGHLETYPWLNVIDHVELKED